MNHSSAMLPLSWMEDIFQDQVYHLQKQKLDQQAHDVPNLVFVKIIVWKRSSSKTHEEFYNSPKEVYHEITEPCIYQWQRKPW